MYFCYILFSFRAENQIIWKPYFKKLIGEIKSKLHLRFAEEELDFIINYDIIYRMGKELDEVWTVIEAD